MKISKEDLVIGATFNGLNYGDGINAVKRVIELTFTQLDPEWKGTFVRPLPPRIGHKVQGNRYQTPQAIIDLLNPWTRGSWNGKPEVSAVDNYELELTDPTDEALAFSLKGQLHFQGQDSSIARLFILHPDSNPKSLVVDFSEPTTGLLLPTVEDCDLEKVGQKLAAEYAAEQDEVLRSIKKATKLNRRGVKFPFSGGLPGHGRKL